LISSEHLFLPRSEERWSHICTNDVMTDALHISAYPDNTLSASNQISQQGTPFFSSRTRGHPTSAVVPDQLQVGPKTFCGLTRKPLGLLSVAPAVRPSAKPTHLFLHLG
jgi:hypothetical protein